MLYIQLILLFLACSLWIVGFHNATTEGYILYPLRHFGDKYLPELLQNPFYGCPMCMASVHGGLWFLFWFKVGLNVHDIAMLILFIVSLSGFMKILYKNTILDL